MLVPALLVAFAYWITWLIDGILGWQTMTRPIVLGTVIGLLCGDLKTGVIMGASLEAVYMGISGIGGSLAADYRSGTAVGVGLAILSGISMEVLFGPLFLLFWLSIIFLLKSTNFHYKYRLSINQ